MSEGKRREVCSANGLRGPRAWARMVLSLHPNMMDAVTVGDEGRNSRVTSRQSEKAEIGTLLYNHTFFYNLTQFSRTVSVLGGGGTTSMTSRSSATTLWNKFLVQEPLEG